MAISEMAGDSSKLLHQRVRDKILRRKFGIHLSSISNNKGATAPRNLPFGLRIFSKNYVRFIAFSTSLMRYNRQTRYSGSSLYNISYIMLKVLCKVISNRPTVILLWAQYYPKIDVGND